MPEAWSLAEAAAAIAAGVLEWDLARAFAGLNPGDDTLGHGSRSSHGAAETDDRTLAPFTADDGDAALDDAELIYSDIQQQNPDALRLFLCAATERAQRRYERACATALRPLEAHASAVATQLAAYRFLAQSASASPRCAKPTAEPDVRLFAFQRASEGGEDVKLGTGLSAALAGVAGLPWPVYTPVRCTDDGLPIPTLAQWRAVRLTGARCRCRCWPCASDCPNTIVADCITQLARSTHSPHDAAAAVALACADGRAGIILQALAAFLRSILPALSVVRVTLEDAKAAGTHEAAEMVRSLLSGESLAAAAAALEVAHAAQATERIAVSGSGSRSGKRTGTCTTTTPATPGATTPLAGSATTQPHQPATAAPASLRKNVALPAAVRARAGAAMAGHAHGSPGGPSVRGGTTGNGGSGGGSASVSGSMLVARAVDEDDVSANPAAAFANKHGSSGGGMEADALPAVVAASTASTSAVAPLSLAVTRLQMIQHSPSRHSIAAPEQQRSGGRGGGDTGRRMVGSEPRTTGAAGGAAGATPATHPETATPRAPHHAASAEVTPASHGGNIAPTPPSSRPASATAALSLHSAVGSSAAASPREGYGAAAATAAGQTPVLPPISATTSPQRLFLRHPEAPAAHAVSQLHLDGGGSGSNSGGISGLAVAGAPAIAGQLGSTPQSSPRTSPIRSAILHARSMAAAAALEPASRSVMGGLASAHSPAATPTVIGTILATPPRPAAAAGVGAAHHLPAMDLGGSVASVLSSARAHVDAHSTGSAGRAGLLAAPGSTVGPSPQRVLVGSQMGVVASALSPAATPHSSPLRIPSASRSTGPQPAATALQTAPATPHAASTSVMAGPDDAETGQPPGDAAAGNPATRVALALGARLATALQAAFVASVTSPAGGSRAHQMLDQGGAGTHFRESRSSISLPTVQAAMRWLSTSATMVVAAGQNAYGELGLKVGGGGCNGPDIALPTRVTAFDCVGVVSLGAGNEHSLFLRGGARPAVVAQGYNFAGQCGAPRVSSDHRQAGDSTAAQHKRLVAVHLPVPGDMEPVAVYAANGAEHSFVLTRHRDGTSGDDGKCHDILLAFGNNSRGQLGIGRQPATVHSAMPVDFTPLMASLTIPWPISMPLRISLVACSYNHTLAVTASGALLGWGRNDHGQLGQAGRSDIDRPSLLIPLHVPLVAAAIAGHGSAALPYADEGWQQFAVAFATRPGAEEALATARPLHIVSIACGQHHSLVVLSSGRVLAAGKDDWGQVARDMMMGYAAVGAPRGFSWVPGVVDVVRVAASYYASMFVTRNGTLMFCGRTASDERMHMPRAVTFVPQPPSGMRAIRVIDATAGCYHFVAVTEDEAGNQGVWAWGRNTHGCLGLPASATIMTAPGETPVVHQPKQLAIPLLNEPIAAVVGDDAVADMPPHVRTAATSLHLRVRSVACGFYHTLVCLGPNINDHAAALATLARPASLSAPLLATTASRVGQLCSTAAEACGVQQQASDALNRMIAAIASDLVAWSAEARPAAGEGPGTAVKSSAGLEFAKWPNQVPSPEWAPASGQLPDAADISLLRDGAVQMLPSPPQAFDIGPAALAVEAAEESLESSGGLSVASAAAVGHQSMQGKPRGTLLGSFFRHPSVSSADLPPTSSAPDGDGYSLEGRESWDTRHSIGSALKRAFRVLHDDILVAASLNELEGDSAAAAAVACMAKCAAVAESAHTVLAACDSVAVQLLEIDSTARSIIANSSGPARALADVAGATVSAASGVVAAVVQSLLTVAAQACGFDVDDCELMAVWRRQVSAVPPSSPLDWATERVFVALEYCISASSSNTDSTRDAALAGGATALLHARALLRQLAGLTNDGIPAPRRAHFALGAAVALAVCSLFIDARAFAQLMRQHLGGGDVHEGTITALDPLVALALATAATWRQASDRRGLHGAGLAELLAMTACSFAIAPPADKHREAGSITRAVTNAIRHALVLPCLLSRGASATQHDHRVLSSSVEAPVAIVEAFVRCCSTHLSDDNTGGGGELWSALPVSAALMCLLDPSNMAEVDDYALLARVLEVCLQVMVTAAATGDGDVMYASRRTAHKAAHIAAQLWRATADSLQAPDRKGDAAAFETLGVAISRVLAAVTCGATLSACSRQRLLLWVAPALQTVGWNCRDALQSLDTRAMLELLQHHSHHSGPFEDIDAVRAAAAACIVGRCLALHQQGRYPESVALITQLAALPRSYESSAPIMGRAVSFVLRDAARSALDSSPHSLSTVFDAMLQLRPPLTPATAPPATSSLPMRIGPELLHTFDTAEPAAPGAINAQFCFQLKRAAAHARDPGTPSDGDVVHPLASILPATACQDVERLPSGAWLVVGVSPACDRLVAGFRVPPMAAGGTGRTVVFSSSVKLRPETWYQVGVVTRCARDSHDTPSLAVSVFETTAPPACSWAAGAGYAVFAGALPCNVVDAMNDLLTLETPLLGSRRGAGAGGTRPRAALTVLPEAPHGLVAAHAAAGATLQCRAEASLSKGGNAVQEAEAVHFASCVLRCAIASAANNSAATAAHVLWRLFLDGTHIRTSCGALHVLSRCAGILPPADMDAACASALGCPVKPGLAREMVVAAAYAAEVGARRASGVRVPCCFQYVANSCSCGDCITTAAQHLAFAATLALSTWTACETGGWGGYMAEMLTNEASAFSGLRDAHPRVIQMLLLSACSPGPAPALVPGAVCQSDGVVLSPPPKLLGSPATQVIVLVDTAVAVMPEAASATIGLCCVRDKDNRWQVSRSPVAGLLVQPRSCTIAGMAWLPVLHSITASLMAQPALDDADHRILLAMVSILRLWLPDAAAHLSALSACPTDQWRLYGDLTSNLAQLASSPPLVPVASVDLLVAAAVAQQHLQRTSAYGSTAANKAAGSPSAVVLPRYSGLRRGCRTVWLTASLLFPQRRRRRAEPVRGDDEDGEIEAGGASDQSQEHSDRAAAEVRRSRPGTADSVRRGSAASTSSAVDALASMGFDRNWCAAALQLADGDLAVASAWLVDNIELVTAAAGEEAIQAIMEDAEQHALEARIESASSLEGTDVPAQGTARSAVALLEDNDSVLYYSTAQGAILVHSAASCEASRRMHLLAWQDGVDLPAPSVAALRLSALDDNADGQPGEVDEYYCMESHGDQQSGSCGCGSGCRSRGEGWWRVLLACNAEAFASSRPQESNVGTNVDGDDAKSLSALLQASARGLFERHRRLLRPRRSDLPSYSASSTLGEQLAAVYEDAALPPRSPTRRIICIDAPSLLPLSSLTPLLCHDLAEESEAAVLVRQWGECSCTSGCSAEMTSGDVVRATLSTFLPPAGAPGIPARNNATAGTGRLLLAGVLGMPLHAATSSDLSLACMVLVRLAIPVVARAALAHAIAAAQSGALASTAVALAGNIGNTLQAAVQSRPFDSGYTSDVLPRGDVGACLCATPSLPALLRAAPSVIAASGSSPLWNWAMRVFRDGVPAPAGASSELTAQIGGSACLPSSDRVSRARVAGSVLRCAVELTTDASFCDSVMRLCAAVIVASDSSGVRDAAIGLLAVAGSRRRSLASHGAVPVAPLPGDLMLHLQALAAVDAAKGGLNCARAWRAIEASHAWPAAAQAPRGDPGPPAQSFPAVGVCAVDSNSAVLSISPVQPSHRIEIAVCRSVRDGGGRLDDADVPEATAAAQIFEDGSLVTLPTSVTCATTLPRWRIIAKCDVAGGTDGPSVSLALALGSLPAGSLWLVRARAAAATDEPRASPAEWGPATAFLTAAPPQLMGWDAASAGPGVMLAPTAVPHARGTPPLDASVCTACCTIDETWSCIRSTAHFSHGRNVWNVRIDNAPTSYVCVGVATATVDMASFLGSDLCGWGILGDGALYHKHTKVGSAAISFGSGDVVTLTLDCDEGTLAAAVNGVSAGVVFRGIRGQVHAAASFYSRDTCVTILKGKPAEHIGNADVQTGAGGALPADTVNSAQAADMRSISVAAPQLPGFGLQPWQAISTLPGGLGNAPHLRSCQRLLAFLRDDGTSPYSAAVLEPARAVLQRCISGNERWVPLRGGGEAWLDTSPEAVRAAAGSVNPRLSTLNVSDRLQFNQAGGHSSSALVVGARDGLWVRWEEDDMFAEDAGAWFVSPKALESAVVLDDDSAGSVEDLDDGCVDGGSDLDGASVRVALPGMGAVATAPGAPADMKPAGATAAVRGSAAALSYETLKPALTLAAGMLPMFSWLAALQRIQHAGGSIIAVSTQEIVLATDDYCRAQTPLLERRVAPWTLSMKEVVDGIVLPLVAKRAAACASAEDGRELHFIPQTPWPQLSGPHATVAEVIALAAAARFIVCRHFNYTVRPVLASMDADAAPCTVLNMFSTVEQPVPACGGCSLFCRLRQGSNVLFWHTKTELLSSWLEATATLPTRPDDPMDWPEELPIVSISRPRASSAMAAQESGFAGRVKASVFGQAHTQLQDMTASMLRLAYTHPMDDGQVRTWRVKALDEGAEDYSGVFRQMFASICDELQARALLRSADGAGIRADGLSDALARLACLLPLLVPSSNAISDIGDDRHWFCVNPFPVRGTLSDAAIPMAHTASTCPLGAALWPSQLMGPGEQTPVPWFRTLGRILGVAIRCRIMMPLDLAPMVWKLLASEPLAEADLAAVDTGAVRLLDMLDAAAASHAGTRMMTAGCGFSSPSVTAIATHLHSCTACSRVVDRGCAIEGWEDATWTTAVTSGHTVEVVPGGAMRPITVGDVFSGEYRRMVVQARLHEASPFVQAIRDGLHDVVPQSALRWLSSADLERTLCGAPDVDVDALEATAEYDEGIRPQDAHVQHLWKVLRELTREQRLMFLHFVSARKRVPAPSECAMRLRIQPTAPLPGADADEDAAAAEGGGHARRRGASVALQSHQRPASATTARALAHLPERMRATAARVASEFFSSTAGSAAAASSRPDSAAPHRHGNAANVAAESSNASSLAVAVVPGGRSFVPETGAAAAAGWRRAGQRLNRPVTAAPALTASRRLQQVQAQAPDSTPAGRPPRAGRLFERQQSVTTAEDGRLPTAATCFAALTLPRYSSADILKQRLLYAITNCFELDADFLVHESTDQEAGAGGAFPAGPSAMSDAEW